MEPFGKEEGHKDDVPPSETKPKQPKSKKKKIPKPSEKSSVGGEGRSAEPRKPQGQGAQGTVPGAEGSRGGGAYSAFKQSQRESARGQQYSQGNQPSQGGMRGQFNQGNQSNPRPIRGGGYQSPGRGHPRQQGPQPYPDSPRGGYGSPGRGHPHQQGPQPYPDSPRGGYGSPGRGHPRQRGPQHYNPPGRGGGYGSPGWGHPNQPGAQPYAYAYNEGSSQPMNPRAEAQPYDYRGNSGQQRRQQQQGQQQQPRTPNDRNQGVHDGSANKNRRKASGGKQNKPKFTFEPYLSKEDVQRGLKNGELLEAAIRINPRNYEDSYIPHPDGYSDVYIAGMKHRNRALNGDIVAVMLLPASEWKVLIDDVKKNDIEAEFDELQIEDKVKPELQGSAVGDEVIVEEEYIVEDKTCEASGPKVLTEATSEGRQPSSDADTNAVVPIATPTATLDSTETLTAPNLDMAVAEGQTTKAESDKCQPDATGIEAKTEKGNPEMNVAAKPTVSQGQELMPPKLSGSAADKKAVTPGGSKPGQGSRSSAKRNTPAKRYLTLEELSRGGSDVDLKPSVRKLFAEDDGKVKDGDVTKKKNKGADGLGKDLVIRTGKVVYIVERKHSRACTGHVKPMQDMNRQRALFAPVDHRLPRIMVPMADCPPTLLERPEDHAKTLFIAHITDWPEESMMASGNLARSLGEAGQIEPETTGILIEYGVDFEEFSDEALQCLPQNLPWQIPAVEYEQRRDLRKECIFTIDPATARDLDDALSCNKLDNGLYQVGVHIADVSYFLQGDTKLDEVAGERATSVYLVQKVVPMLPRLLCEKLCSLNPDEDRLTFSVMWTMTEQGEIRDEWFGRTVIRSCAKLSYDHAQGFIEQPDREWTTQELPPISEGFTVPEIKERVLSLHQMALHMRQKRFDGGALRLDQVKLQFALDSETGLPNGYSVYQQRDSNKLVEEFMLFANMAVANKIYKSFPEVAPLRRHPAPRSKMMDDLSTLCRTLGLTLDTTSAGTLQASLQQYTGPSVDECARTQILTALCSKPMQNARYFCTGVVGDEDLFRHYALNVPLYTHFTSPIRRYTDVMVHRLLAAAMGYAAVPGKSKAEIHRQCEHCNDKKTSSKRVQELSSELFFSVFVKECGPLEERGMVMAVLDKAFDVLVLSLGVVKRVYLEKLPLKDHKYRRQRKAPELLLTWAAAEGHAEGVTQTITIFTPVSCRLYAEEDGLKWSAVILHPDEILPASAL